MRLILHTGKGGVGKTTLSAATATALAAAGHRTLVVSTDAAHSLADALRRPLTSGTVRVRPRLWAEEIHVEREIDAVWGAIGGYVERLLASGGINDVLAEELAIPPGAEEIFALLRIEEAARSGRYDALVVDCAPTGSTLRLLALPDLLRWYMDKLYRWQRRLLTVLRPFAERIAHIPLPDEGFYDAVEHMFARIDALHALLSDPARTSVRLVTLPERMAVAETRRALTQLALFGYPVDAVLVNRVLPAGVDLGVLAKARRAQERVMREIATSFADLRVLTAPALPEEPGGPKALAELAGELYAGADPLAIRASAPPMSIESGAEGPVLRLRLPFVEKSEVEVWTKDDELIVATRPASGGRQRRNWLLPRALAGREVRRARLADGVLEVHFGATRADAERSGDEP